MREPADPESREAIGYRLELMRLALTDLNQAEIAAALGMTPGAWNQYIKGNVRPGLDMGLRICLRYGVTLDWIYRGHSYAVPTGIMDRLNKKASELASKGRPKRETS